MTVKELKAYLESLPENAEVNLMSPIVDNDSVFLGTEEVPLLSCDVIYSEFSNSILIG
jgi:hypothetical protein